MKTKVLILIPMLLLLFTVQAQRVNGARVGYIDMEYILENVPAYQEANTQLEAKAQRWKSEIQKKQGTIDQMKKNLSAERVLLTKELIDEREEEIEILEQELQKYQQDRFGPFGSLMVQRQNMVKPIQDQVLNAVQDIAQKKRYDFVFDKSADVVMLFSSKKFDISDQVLRIINRDEKRKGREAKIKAKNEKTKFEDEGETTVNPEVEARKQVAEEKREERQKLLDDRKQKRLEEREAKKKEYEERRKKLIEEREAKKKAAEEKRKQREEEKRKKLEERKKKLEERKKQQEENKENEEGSGAGNGN